MRHVTHASVVLAALVALSSPPSARADEPIEEELVEIDEALAAHPHDLLLLLTHADLYLEAGEPLRSLDDLALAGALAPRDAHIPALRAEALAALERIDEALVEIARAERLGLTTPRLLVLRARLLTRAARDEEAVVAWDDALAAADDLDGYLARSTLLDRLGRADAALASLEEGLAITGSTVLRLSVIDRAVARGDFDHALEVLDPLLVEHAGALRGRWLVRRGEILDRAGRRDQARESFEEARAELARLAIRRPSAAVRVNLGRALLGLGRVDEARVEARRALSTSPALREGRELLTRVSRAAGGAR